ncbi:hypothetical protein C8R44DRAFT_877522 [Mycena epipterygia]|nr:hypothetical protein C8R44DRAFT_877522 [Mycena epipterygia]
MFHLLFSCCIRSGAPADDDPTVIPTETSHLIPASGGLSSPGLPETITVDHQKLNDRLGTIVRAKEGKMVNVSSRSPFTLQNAEASTSSPASPTSAYFPLPTTMTSPTQAPVPPISTSSPLASRRPPVLTMTPARSKASLNLCGDSRYSSPSGSRSSSRRRPDPSDRYTYCGPSSAVVEGGRVKGRKASTASDWFGETESESSCGERPAGEAEPPNSGLPIVTTKEDLHVNTQSIAFSWGDT